MKRISKFGIRMSTVELCRDVKVTYGRGYIEFVRLCLGGEESAYFLGCAEFEDGI